jgi:hypothetical protein
MEEGGETKGAAAVVGEILAGKVQELFSVNQSGEWHNGSWEGRTYTEEELRGAIASVLEAGISVARLKGKEVIKTDLKFKDFFRPGETRLDWEKTGIELEAALGELRGERKNDGALMKVMANLVANQALQNEEEKQKRIERERRGLLWRVPAEARQRVEDEFAARDEQAKQIMNRVVEYAPKWARKDGNGQEQT